MNRADRVLIGAACCYELAALATGRVPTISSLCRRHRAAEAVLIAALLTHLHHPQPVKQPSQPVRHGKDRR